MNDNNKDVLNDFTNSNICVFVSVQSTFETTTTQIIRSSRCHMLIAENENTCPDSSLLSSCAGLEPSKFNCLLLSRICSDMMF